MQKQELYAKITRHGENLKTLFNLPADTDPVKLCKQLFRLENAAHRAAEDYCNGDIDAAHWETFETKTLAKVDKLLKFSACSPPVPVFVNGDPRGYALKIGDKYMSERRTDGTTVALHRDMGGFGILAPDFRN